MDLTLLFFDLQASISNAQEVSFGQDVWIGRLGYAGSSLYQKAMRSQSPQSLRPTLVAYLHEWLLKPPSAPRSKEGTHQTVINLCSTLTSISIIRTLLRVLGGTWQVPEIVET